MHDGKVNEISDLAIGIIGCGQMARRFAGIFVDLGARIIAIHDHEENRANSFKADLGLGDAKICKYRDDLWTELENWRLRDHGQSAIYCAVHPLATPQISCEAASAGIHQLIEKPLGGDLSAVRRTVDATSRQFAVAEVDCQYDESEAVEDLAKRISGGQFGQIQSVTFRHSSDENNGDIGRSQSIKSLLMSGIYPIYSSGVHRTRAYERLLGQGDLVGINGGYSYSTAAELEGHPNCQFAAVQMKHDWGEVTFSVEISWYLHGSQTCHPETYPYWQICGTAGRAVWLPRKQLIRVYHKSSERELHFVADKQLYERKAKRFVDCIRGDESRLSSPTNLEWAHGLALSLNEAALSNPTPSRVDSAHHLAVS